MHKRCATAGFTDLCVVDCVTAATDARHGGPLLAANMIKTGERYGYAFGLALELMQRPGGLAQLHLDIMCKWEPWQRRVMAALANWDGPLDGLVAELRDRVSPLSGSFDEMRKVLSYAHGTLHAMNCQVRLLCYLQCIHCFSSFLLRNLQHI